MRTSKILKKSSFLRCQLKWCQLMSKHITYGEDAINATKTAVEEEIILKIENLR
jgi:hypothetical protein